MAIHCIVLLPAEGTKEFYFGHAVITCFHKLELLVSFTIFMLQDTPPKIFYQETKIVF